VTNRVVCSHVLVKEFIVGREAPAGRVGDWLMTSLYWGGAVRLGLHRSHPANRLKTGPAGVAGEAGSCARSRSALLIEFFQGPQPPAPIA
jgi:hypothetical protein